MAEQRQRSLERRGRPADRRQFRRPLHIARAGASFHCARCSCQKPSPIISATAAATMIVGTMGKRRIIRRSALRAPDAYIPAREARPWRCAGRRSSARPLPESRRGAPTRAARRRASSDERGDNDDRADDQDQESRGAIADVEAVKVEAAAAAAVRELHPARRTSVCVPQRGQSPCSAAASDEACAHGSRGHPACGAPQPPQT